MRKNYGWSFVQSSPTKLMQLIRGRKSVCTSLCELDSLPLTLVCQEVPEAADAGTGEQPQLPVAGLAPQELQHRRRVGAGQPLRLGHRLALRYVASVSSMRAWSGWQVTQPALPQPRDQRWICS